MRTWVVFLAGPVIWLVHFLAVYVFVEAACAAGGAGFAFGGVSGVSWLTLAATVAATAAALLFAGAGYRRWRAGEADAAAQPDLAFGGFLLGVLFSLAILFVGLPAAVLGC